MNLNELRERYDQERMNYLANKDNTTLLRKAADDACVAMEHTLKKMHDGKIKVEAVTKMHDDLLDALYFRGLGIAMIYQTANDKPLNDIAKQASKDRRGAIARLLIDSGLTTDETAQIATAADDAINKTMQFPKRGAGRSAA